MMVVDNTVHDTLKSILANVHVILHIQPERKHLLTLESISVPVEF